MLSAALLVVLTATPLGDGWSWRHGDLPVVGGHVTAPADGWLPVTDGALRRPTEGEPFVWLRRTLPPTLESNAVLAIDSVIGHFEFFVAGARVYSFPPEAGVEGRGMRGLQWHLVPLPAGAANAELLMRVRSTYPLAGIQGVPSLTTRAEFFEDLLRDDTPRFVIGCFLWLIAALSLVALRGGGRKLAVALAAHAAAGGTYVLFYTRLKQVLLPVPPPLWLMLYVASMAVLAAAYFAVLGALFEAKGPWLRRFERGHTWLGAAVVGVCLLLWLLTDLSDGPSGGNLTGFGFFVVTTVLRGSMLVTSLWSTVLLVQWARGRGAPADVTRARIVLVGVVVLMVAVWLNTAASVGWVVLPGNYVPLGLLTLTLALAVLAERGWRETQERVVASERALLQRAQEKEAMLRDLHDGIGSVTTNIRMLAELGQRDEKRAVTSLATIAELSTEGIAELRAFIQSLDESQVDWALLSAELRRFGGQLIESQGMQFQLDAELQPSAPPPTGAITLALLRVFRESLTNVVKHAGAKAVTARLVVGERALSLTVRDDGAGASKGAGVNLGRGLRNMRARAEELGGRFQFERGEGATVRFELPLG